MPKENRHGIPGMKTTKSGRYRIELPLQFKNADGKRMCTSSHLTMEGDELRIKSEFHPI